MGTIEALGRMPMNSYTSHTFAVATSRGTYKEETFTVTAGQSTYSVFGGHAVQIVDETPGDRRVSGRALQPEIEEQRSQS